ncbi:2OG-Fe(II) oxygenase family protein [Tahibacter harae]|uniref:2OG-Fe(II) oxygenase n=1 Tax=Tahibacter harae TaxID=2963937 RepID=A0ABT1QNF7_9GAMM|nr:2OG-Fe(II) oxygenase [Tahibacter harae]MCQ4164064.1 2OG-Fe(II) oxygenase [Tahibacter harae]
MSETIADLRRYIRVYDQAFDADTCAQMVASFNSLQRFHRANGRNARAGLENSAWVELDITPLADAAFKGFIFATIDQYLARYNAELGLTIPIPPSNNLAELIIKRYRPAHGEVFQPHFDSLGPVANRYLVFLWYLNDVAEGGQTRFVDLDVDVAPKAGRLLIFPPYWMFQHEALAPRSNEKYILSTYLLFK